MGAQGAIQTQGDSAMSVKEEMQEKEATNKVCEAPNGRNLRAVQVQNRSLKASRSKKVFPCHSCPGFDGVAKVTSNQLMAAWTDAFLPGLTRLMVTVQLQEGMSHERACKTISIAANMRDQGLLGKRRYLKASKAQCRSFEILFPETGDGCNDKVDHYHGLLLVPTWYDLEREFVPVATHSYLRAMATVMQNPESEGSYHLILRQLQLKQSHASGKPVLIEPCRDIQASRIYALKWFSEGKLPIETVNNIPKTQRLRLPQVTNEEFAELLYRHTGVLVGTSQN